MRRLDFQVRRIAGFGLTSSDAARLLEFYEQAFGAQHLLTERVAIAPFERLMRVEGGAERHILQLGGERVEILEFDSRGKPYPRPVSPYNTTFQHFALVVSEMDRAMAHLKTVPGWTPLSKGGPQHLPQRSGGVTAFKFEDPEGHPLELLAFPSDTMPKHWQKRSKDALFLGIDHSAISIRDTAESTAFYQALGFQVTDQTYNHGLAQAHLDGVPSPQVKVTALCAQDAAPHLELLCYQGDANRPRRLLASNDVAATRVLLAGDPMHDEARIDPATRLIVDPDGHHLLLLA